VAAVTYVFPTSYEPLLIASSSYWTFIDNRRVNLSVPLGQPTLSCGGECPHSVLSDGCLLDELLGIITG
jgi:hypothetical protein